MFIEYLPETETITEISLNHAVLNDIKTETEQDILKVMGLGEEFLRYIDDNNEDITDKRINLLYELVNNIESVEDIISYCKISLKNSKLGNKTAVYNLSSYCNCYGIISGYCNCSKECYAGKLEFRQIIRSFKNYIFVEYCIRTANDRILYAGLNKAMNEAIHEVNGCFSDIQALRFDEVGEIRDLAHLKHLEAVYEYFKIFKNSLKAYTYSTNRDLLKEFKGSEIVIRQSTGFIYNYGGYNNYSSIVNSLEDVKTAFYRATANNLKVFICPGSCKACKLCTMSNTVILFVNHANTSEKQLKLKIKEFEAYLKRLKDAY